MTIRCFFAALFGLASFFSEGCCESRRVPFSIEPAAVERGVWTNVRVKFVDDVSALEDPSGKEDDLRVVIVETGASNSLAAYVQTGEADEGIRNLVLVDSRTVAFDIAVPEDWSAGEHHFSVQLGSVERCTGRGAVQKLVVR